MSRENTPPAERVAAGRTIAIGDIHGCAHALDAVLAAIGPRPEDQIICLGDVIDNGRDTALVLERLLQLRRECRLVCILGNHEEMLLGALQNERIKDSWQMCGGVYTLNSYRFGGDLDVIPAAHLEFIRTFRDYYETEQHLFTHANYDQQLAMEDQLPHTRRWSLLEDMAPQPHCSGKTVIVGHTEQKSGEVLDLRCVKCIDTYCWGYRWLTALEVETGHVWQASRWGVLRDADESLEGLQKAKQILAQPLAQ
ncbi:MAG: metallophosphoesterase family protein [Planctomycetales bacterium]